MIVLTFNVIGTDLRRTDINRIVAVSRNNVSAKFNFNSDWDDISPKVVQFYKNEEYYNVSLENDECNVPWEVLTEAGTLSITVTGGDLITTTTVDINIYGTGLSDSGLVPTVASPGVYSEIVKLASNIESDYSGMKSIIDAYEETVNNSMTDISEAVANSHENEMNAAESASEANKSAESALNSLEELKNTVINIVDTAEGRTITATDCSNKNPNVYIFGESTQDGMPTMENPVEIVNKVTDSVTLYVHNKNLLTAQFTEDNKITDTATKDDYTVYNASYPFYITKGNTYTFSFESDGTAGSASGTDTVQAGVFDVANGKHYMTMSDKYLTFTAAHTGKCSFRYDINKNGCTHSFWNFQIEVGDIKTEYVEGNKQSIEITLSEPLRCIPIESGGNYTDDMGQQYLADVICEKDGQIGVLRCVNYMRLTSNGFTLFKEYENGNKISFQKSLGLNYYNESGLCTHFELSHSYNVDTMWLPDTRIIVTVSDDYTLDTFKTFLNENEVYLAVTCKNNPTFEVFNEEVQEKFKALNTYYGITNVNNSAGAYNKIEYVADTKLYIDNKINEIAKAVVATESEV